MLAAAYYATPKHLRPDFSKKVKQEQTPKEEPVQEEQPAEEPVQEEQPVDVSSEEPSSSEESTTETAEQLAETEEEVNKEGAYNPETGEINWDCPCLGGMAHGTCGEEFKEAFACFVYSDADPKGIDCVEKFQHMQDCFRAHPEEYAEQLKDEEEATAAAEAVGAAETPGEGDGSREDSTESFEVVAAPDKSPETDAEPVFQETDDILSSSDESTPDAELQTPTEELDPMEEVELTESS
ncbi:coiled-coil-helix-coiled-coil-helix domain-containing protein KNAG_0B06490 [Huiozyma naganishii CBS 8797]|uniref:Mitochondrial intermembrane space import and assembly protein 40 n=1 Tax=Huiozyma naganishii (strain ATCC MYA-139 / BCRC 22969 / CBS 8797 / KCTC 17520 / NBRC 10181 / NCYC 3082 / Yp74L-3) TaxID=1071383 RepID=J7RVV1_HUIN7|nr:hypothetical protein KNAG_0B06490 [Kazachstania naganishii CBS 8797]CCK69077.1 hypothetical protein KNAG_0B06490 [Kazachstania naganishii CBS 8797]